MVVEQRDKGFEYPRLSNVPEPLPTPPSTPEADKPKAA
jgi:hypothetical protein